VHVRPISDADADWIETFLREEWGVPVVVSRGRLHDPRQLPGFVAEDRGERMGLATYRVDGDEWELVTINSVVERRGAGTALVEAVAGAAREAGCRRLWLITTNDNVPAQRFYERRGFRLAAVHEGAIEESRRLKPQISETGIGGVPVLDELEYELLLG
jgi:N-acetylglutamate synthase-like GNAT family acetyltransferase